jgi:S1-C subfamily serine protease
MAIAKFWKKQIFWLIVLIIFLSSLFGFLTGLISGSYFYYQIKDYLSKWKITLPQKIKEDKKENDKKIDHYYFCEQEAIIKTIKEASPAVVSIIITKDLPIIEEYFFEPFEEFEEFFGEPFFKFKIPQYRKKGTEKREIGGGTGFIISQEGMVLTNKHVVLDKEADYTVLTNDGRKFKAKVLARDPFQDLAILKIEAKEKFPVVKLGDSDKLEIGQTVIAIGNALGEFRNTVSVGVISGLGRTITATGGGMVETLEDVIQTDAAINRGNSGGPLLNLKGQVIGVNTAMAFGAENIGFAIPINKAKRDIEQVKTLGKIIYPFLGIYYTLITKELQKEYQLPVDYGAWIGRDKLGRKTKEAVLPNTAAEKAGLKRDDIILEFNQEKITLENPLGEIIKKYNPGEKINLKILRGKEEKIIKVVLDERSG